MLEVEHNFKATLISSFIGRVRSSVGHTCQNTASRKLKMSNKDFRNAFSDSSFTSFEFVAPRVWTSICTNEATWRKKHTNVMNAEMGRGCLSFESSKDVLTCIDVPLKKIMLGGII